MKRGDVTRAIEWLEHGLDKFPRSDAVKNNLAMLYESVGRYEDAEKLYCQVLARESDSHVVVRNLADLYYRLTLYGAALEYYEQIPDDHRDSPMLMNLGHIYLSRGDHKDALFFFERAHEMNPDNIEATYAVKALRELVSSSGL